MRWVSNERSETNQMLAVFAADDDVIDGDQSIYEPGAHGMSDFLRGYMGQ